MCWSYIDTLVSGSPILQDGKLIGAVTHVLISDPTARRLPAIAIPFAGLAKWNRLRPAASSSPQNARFCGVPNIGIFIENMLSNAN